MATLQMRVRTIEPGEALKKSRAAARLLATERSEEIFPVLLEEIVRLGYHRVLVARVDFETSVVMPFASLNCSKEYQQKFKTSLYAMENPVVRALHSLTPQIFPAEKGTSVLYCHPLLFRNKFGCWEAERRPVAECLAFDNAQLSRKLNLQDQVCGTCHMRAYAAVVVVEARQSETKQLAEVGTLIDLSNRYLSRLFKVEHYYNRMSDMEVTIGQMETVLASMADPVVLTDTQHRVVMQNKVAERFFKLPEEVSEGRVRAVELNNLLFSTALSSMSISGSDTSRDMTLVDPVEGEELLFEAVSAATIGKNGRQTGMVTVMRNVTDLRRADQELRMNYERLRAAEELVRQDRDRLNVIVENVGDPIVVCDNQAKIVLIDPLAQELLGEKDGHRQSWQVQNQARFDAYVSSFTFSFSDRASGPLRLFQPESGGEIDYDARSGKIFDERGMVAFSVTVLRDFTAVKKLEQLKLEQRMLEMEKFAAAGRLAGMIAHEVNNPMEAIKNCIYLLTEGIKPESKPVYQILKSETERVSRIVRQMLGLYRNTDQVGNVDVNAIVEDTILLFSRQLERVSIQVKTDLPPLPVVTGSADQIRQVLSNLVVNAKDSMASGGTLTVRTRQMVPPGSVKGWVRIMVADTGCGIPKHVLENMFEPFITTKGERGTGLGLWIVKGIIENHGGKLRVRSKPGRGTAFRIDLPVIR